MPKSLFVDPKKVRKAEILKIKDIPVNQYQSNFEKELKTYGADRLKRILYDMQTIRAFETMLNTFKTQGAWENIEYNHKGPAHLSMGQEAAAVGQCVNLGIDDFIFGSHRSHGEILAKCYSAVEKLSEKELEKIMKEFLGGDTLKMAEKIGYKNVKDLAENFVLYGTLAEIFARNAGFNRGLGGSMHAYFLPFGSMPNNAIVGGSADIATGSALFKRINKKKGIVISNVGDAALGCGPVWEAMMMAAMDQYNNLWPESVGGAPPILFNFFNNFYGMGGQTCGETMGYQYVARVGAGVNPDNMHAERVDGYNPLAVADAIARKKEILLKGKGPVLLDTITYRVSGHSPSDASSYRTKEEIEAWEKADAIEEYKNYLIKNKLITKSDAEKQEQAIREKLIQVVKLAVNDEESPRASAAFIESVMFSNTKAEKMEEGKPEVLDVNPETNVRLKAIAGKTRSAFGADGKPVSKNKTFQYRDGLFEAMFHRFTIDPTMAAWGEENRDWGGAFAVYRGLTEALPYQRLFNSPISEAAIVGAGVGYAMSGGRAVVELMYCDFMGRAGDEIFNQASKWQSMSAGLLKMPLTVRVSVGNKYGAQHSQDWSAIVAAIPGLKAVFPATPYDAKGMLNYALRGTDPVIFFESQKLYDKGEEFEKEVPAGYYEVPEGEPAIRKTGKDITIATLGATLYTAMDTAKILQEKYGMDAEVIDIRWINPLNYEKLVESVKKTGKILLASDAAERGSYLHTVASNIGALAFDYLDAPPAVLGSRNWITPAPECEHYYFPSTEWMLDTIHERIIPLKGHTPKSVQTTMDIMRKNRMGV
ncbi:MAG: alpha-ketoacid dehydrogenase subunit alpha/beta [Treponema sp.]|uniref:alpha-ketoacid dehydrogenase subunit alpha/beta n=1 Tax=Treponema sp. TaxID=166 RepID=UPI003FA1E2A8